MVIKCEACKGTGVKQELRLCETCNNHRLIHFYVPGYGDAIKLCPTCKGHQEYDEVPCPKCDGQGFRFV